MKAIGLCTLTAIGLLMLPLTTSAATKAYSNASQDVSLRNSPGNNSRVVGSIPPGAAVELVKPKEWTLVKFTTPDGNVKDGWVPTRILGPHPPESTLTSALQTENASLKESVASLEKENAERTKREKELTDKLAKAESAYEAIKSGSANYMKIKEEADAAQKRLTSAQENIQTLSVENENLRLSNRIKFFAAGAMVLLVGWFIGWFTGRRQKKGRSTYTL